MMNIHKPSKSIIEQDITTYENWIRDIYQRLGPIRSAVGIPENLLLAEYLGDEFLGEEMYVQIRENGSYKYEDIKIWRTDYIQDGYQFLNKWAYNKHKNIRGLNEQNRAICTTMTRIAAVTIEDDILSTLVIDKWDDVTLDAFATGFNVMKNNIIIECVNGYGNWYRIDISGKYER